MAAPLYTTPGAASAQPGAAPASRLFANHDRALTRDDLTTLHAADIRASRVFGGSET